MIKDAEELFDSKEAISDQTFLDVMELSNQVRQLS